MFHKRFQGFAIFSICPCGDAVFPKFRNHLFITVGVRENIDIEITAALEYIIVIGHLAWTSVLSRVAKQRNIQVVEAKICMGFTR